ncbi:hypothetical protein [Marinibactrum halimedae]|uniref:Porin n=1 Tax=Marinibactrum halimedae TaxID=1444977 RepID=A0AA37T2H9_9GAMM|nr:hypothetical protein [Marinibactrum halimedae]MCD9457673.1 hypothetical protein [Marinibactrum halimedae]GLS24954.1 hypothetical protein GCM10007877_06680 [Marinibactrum halimedae]
MNINRLALITVITSTASMTAYGNSVEQLTNQVKQLNQRLLDQEQRLRINGFATVGVVQQDLEEGYHRGITDELNWRRYSKAALQFTFNIDENTSFVTQLISRGEEDFDTTAEWMYLKHNFGNGWSTKIGRLRKPNYILSEFFDVGYAMPWTQPPVEVYGVLEESANYEAIDFTYDFEIGDWSAFAQAQYGRSETDSSVSPDLFAFNFNMNYDYLTLRAGYSRADTFFQPDSDIGTLSVGVNAAYEAAYASAGLTFDGQVGLNEETAQLAQFFGVAAMYDSDTWLLMAEFNSLEFDGLGVDEDGFYLVGGYRFGQFMPFISYARSESTDDDDREAPITMNPVVDGAVVATQLSFNKEQDRFSLGLRYDFKPGIAFKIQYDSVDTGDTIGEFDTFPSEDTTDVISATVDLVF